jgi:hypothetical protein
MKKFLAVFIGSENSPGSMKWNAMDAETRKAQESAGKKAWMNWVLENAKVIVDHGAPVGKTKQINPSGISDIRNKITAYTVVQAESHEAAAKLFVNHPHFTIFPGDSVEVMECLPIPTL